MVQILAVRVQQPSSHESHIVAVRWFNPVDGQINVATIPVMVDFLLNKQGEAYIFSGRHRIDVIVAEGQPPYLTTRPAYGLLPQSLLTLPRF